MTRGFGLFTALITCWEDHLLRAFAKKAEMEFTIAGKVLRKGSVLFRSAIGARFWALM